MKVIVGPDSELFFGGRELYILDLNFFLEGGGRIQDLDVHVNSFTSNKDHFTSIFQNKSVYLCVNYWSKYHLVLNHLSTLWNSQMSIGVFSVGFCIVRRNLILLVPLYVVWTLEVLILATVFVLTVTYDSHCQSPRVPGWPTVK